MKSEIIKEIKDKIAAEFAKYNIPELIKTVVNASALIKTKCDVIGPDSVPPSNQFVLNNQPEK